MKDREEILLKYLNILRDKLIKVYDEEGLRASGKFERELIPEVQGTRGILYGPSHSIQMNDGRGTGPSDYRKIAPFMLQWIEVKDGLPAIFYEKKQSMAFAIAHKVATMGIKVPNDFNKGQMITRVVEEFLAKDIQDMLEELGQEFIGLIISSVVKLFNQIV